ncbi:hypothetical protein ROZALSC1DRAFT_26577 [Rozella allomycis CSF55]|uniref:CCHC-type domain-containing protein n=1 Tax=Rozella allomycis (strain CSF55) TaxID=988480 RepID=A0A075ATA6_ROZAC|nr:hypothetical protein O9G_001239 [Rozella allomycis CSF55]RKP22027.1 hypothetical protein ROZALSC1DRAFT_26574 [Rozella allomycis CSF55]RKP22029.1 hypothetical protein ROZALSC1DRAFT_26577 [Rozella allomycis CSF55]|eukprot:EPZ33488.1 hypothetical protein O9G_001239 [Rozella allomycis CSF55]
MSLEIVGFIHLKDVHDRITHTSTEIVLNTVRCYNCGGRGHLINDCNRFIIEKEQRKALNEKRKQKLAENPSPIHCIICNEVDHLAADCQFRARSDITYDEVLDITEKLSSPDNSDE